MFHWLLVLLMSGSRPCCLTECTTCSCQGVSALGSGGKGEKRKEGRIGFKMCALVSCQQRRAANGRNALPKQSPSPSLLCLHHHTLYPLPPTSSRPPNCMFRLTEWANSWGPAKALDPCTFLVFVLMVIIIRLMVHGL